MDPVNESLQKVFTTSLQAKPLGENVVAGRKKTWKELHNVVRNVRKQLSNVSMKVPSSVTFKTIDHNHETFTRIYFLSALVSGRETTLLYCDVPHKKCKENEAPQMFPWQSLLESSFQVLHPLRRFSREEQLQWERKRLVMWGITNYDFHADVGRFVFPACGSVFSCNDSGSKQPPFFPTELRSNTMGARLNPQMCPLCADLVAFIYNGDLWVYHIGSASEVRLTHTRKGKGSLADNPLSAGIPPYVTQEEFNRYTGYWWQPCSAQGDNTYRILFEEVDESEVEILHLPSFTDEHGIEEYRFPRVGTPNAKSTLKIALFSLDENNQIVNPAILHLQENLNSFCPQYEYLVRTGWMPDGKSVWTQLLDRAQQNLWLVLIPLSNFVSMDHMEEVSVNHVGGKLTMQVIHEEHSDAWINVHDILYFFPQEKTDELSFLWASEDTGYRHLYLMTVELLLTGTEDNLDGIMERPEFSSVKRIKQKVALTAGDWEVSDNDMWVDSRKNLIYFMGLKDTPLERHLYVVSLDKPGEIERLTNPGYSHAVAMNRECNLFVTIQSNIHQPPFGQVFMVNFSSQGSINTSLLGYILEPMTLEPDRPQPELFSHKLSSGDSVYGMVFKPVGMEPGKKYPTVLTIYGGPEVQLVNNTFKGMRHLRQYLLASEGYVVVAVDGRGSRHRGIVFERHIKGRMGSVEIADQVEVLKWLAENTGYIDTSAVGIHGWSYGGYLSLMGLAQRPDIFKVAVAGAPVTSWNLYDTGYTERYMSTPTNNGPGYTNGSVLSYINQFPDEENRLLIIHGLMDENVHFCHTSQLLSALVKAGKPYNLRVYPTERHSLRHLDASEHYETTLLSFLQDTLTK